MAKLYNYDYYGGTSVWWLRSPGAIMDEATIVGRKGGIGTLDARKYSEASVRPAIWINIEN